MLAEHGRTLVNNLIHASVFCLHSYMLCDVAMVITELILWDREVYKAIAIVVCFVLEHSIYLVLYKSILSTKDVKLFYSSRKFSLHVEQRFSSLKFHWIQEIGLLL